LIPMNDETLEIVMRLRDRAKGLNGTEAQHYVFPACEHGHVDPTRNQRSFRTAWRRLRKAAGLAGLRFHDLRHLAITELAESQVSDQTIMAIAGHVSQKTLARYSHVRSEARRQAVMALSAKQGEASWRETEARATTQVTTQKTVRQTCQHRK
jgi:integrase